MKASFQLQRVLEMSLLKNQDRRESIRANLSNILRYSKANATDGTMANGHDCTTVSVAKFK